MPVNSIHHPLPGAVALLVLFAGIAASASAAVMPFSSNFDSDTVGATTATGFTAAGSAIYSIVQQSAGDNALQAASSNNSGSMAVSLTNAAGEPVSITTDVRLISFSSGSPNPSANFGVGLYGASANFSAGTEYRVLMNLLGSTAGKLFLVRNGTNVTPTLSGNAVAVAADTNYTLTVTATPTAGSLVFHATITDGTSTHILDYTDTSPLTGTFFGYRTASSNAADTVQYDNFSATLVPEPGTLSLLGMSGLLLARRRRQPRLAK